MSRYASAFVLLALVTVGCTSAQTASSTPPGTPSTSASPPASSLGASVAPNALGPEDGTYLALGDSLAVGVGADEPGRGGYVAHIHRDLGNPLLENLAVSGETSASFRSGGQLDAALEVIGAVEPPVTVVTLDIGGNDLLRLLGSEPCGSQPDSPACRQAVALTLAGFDDNFRSALRALRGGLERASPGAVLAVMTYFNPFSGTDAAYEAGGQLALLGRDLELDCRAANRNLADRGMNDIIACVAREFDVRVADVQPRFEGLGLELTHIGAEDIHANERGYEVIADELLDAIRRQGR